MPLDDTYIHFQYARDSPRAGRWSTTPAIRLRRADEPALSPLLALGYFDRLRGWSLAYWALAIGVLSFFGAAVSLPDRAGQPAAFGPPRSPVTRCGWRARSPCPPVHLGGAERMETMLFVFAALLTLHFVQQGRLVPV